MDFRRLVAVLAALWLAGGPGAFAQDRGLKARQALGEDVSIPNYRALVIGINDYKHWQDLRQAREDAQSIARMLRSRYGFCEVRTLFDGEATLDRMLAELRELTRALTPADALLIYYAGHGYYDPLLKKGYWVPTEGRERIGNEPAVSDWLHNTALKEYLDAMQARHVLVVSDSCFSGAMLRGGRVDLEEKANSWYKRAISQPTRWCVASGDLETVPDQSVFARKFLQALQYPRQTVFSASDLAGWIKNEVAEHTGRRPVFGPMNTASGSDLGEFVFLVQDEEPAAAAPPPRAELTAPRAPAPAAAPVTRYGGLVVESALDGVVQVDGAGAYPVTGGRGLKWDRIAAGWHAVKVLSGTQVWESSVEVQEGRFVTVKAFPDAARQAEAAAEAERRRQIDLKAAREAAAKQAELERQRLAYEQAARELEAQRRREQEEEEKKSYRPRAH